MQARQSKPPASSPATRAMEYCQCGARLVVPWGASTVQCAHCRGVTRVERHGAVGFVRDVITNIAGGRRARPPQLPAGPRRFSEAGYPTVQGKKRALLVGVNYTGTEDELHGSRSSTVSQATASSFLPVRHRIQELSLFFSSV